MHELGLRPGTRNHFPEVGHFHTHCHEIEFAARGVLHPGVGNQNPQRREVRAQGHQERDGKVSALAQTVPAEEKEPDHGGFQEEGHQTFNRKRGAEDVAHVVRVVGPVRAELEFHGDAGGNAQGKVNAEKLAPETGHVFVDLTAGYDVTGFHDHQHE